MKKDEMVMTWFKKLLPARCVTAWLVAASGHALAQGVMAPPQVAAPLNTLEAAAENIGVKKCLPAILRLSALALRGSRSNDVLIDWDKTRFASGEEGAVFSMIGLEYANASAAMSITAVPEAAGGCSVSAERVSVAPFTCASVAQQELSGYRPTKLLPTFTVYTDAKEPTSSVSLIDSPPGCLIIRRYVEFNWKDPARK